MLIGETEMPCRYDGPDDNTIMRAELDLVTRMLCEVCTHINEKGLITDISELFDIEGLEKWWEKHEELDQERTRKEIESAKAKLTARERKLLKLN